MVVVICFLMLFASFAQLLDFVWITYVGIGQVQRIRDPWSSVMFIFFVFKIQQLFLIYWKLIIRRWISWMSVLHPPGMINDLQSTYPHPLPSISVFFPYDLRRLIDLHMYDILFFLTNFGYGKTIFFKLKCVFSYIIERHSCVRMYR